MRSRMLYEKVIVLGTGKIALGVLEHIATLRNLYGYRLLYINNGKAICDIGKKCAQKLDIEYQEIYKKKELTEFFLSITADTLIISAGNYYLFSKEMIKMKNLVIINFHNSILPDYPGRNAPSWVIFNGEKETGITWHYVSTGIDDGDIIHREYCTVGSDEKAYQLVERLMRIGVIGFRKCFQKVLDGTVKPVAQNRADDQKIYYAKDVPKNAQCFSDEAGDDIYRLLRSLDYGKADIFPAVTLLHEGRPLKILRYKKVAESSAAANIMELRLSDETYLQIKYRA